MDPRIAAKIHYLVGRGIINVNEMRHHLREYLTNDLFRGQELPPTSNRRFWPSRKDLRNHIVPPQAPDQTRLKRCKGKRVITELFCSCRMPWDKQDGKRRATHMACCDKCEEWFHRSCENIPDRVFKKMSQWKCSKCVHASESIVAKHKENSHFCGEDQFLILLCGGGSAVAGMSA